MFSVNRVRVKFSLLVSVDGVSVKLPFVAFLRRIRPLEEEKIIILKQHGAHVLPSISHSYPAKVKRVEQIPGNVAASGGLLVVTVLLRLLYASIR